MLSFFSSGTARYAGLANQGRVPTENSEEQLQASRVQRYVKDQPSCKGNDIAHQSRYAEKTDSRDMSLSNPQPAAGFSRRELLGRGGKIAAAAAVSSVFSPFVFTGKAAARKTLSFWQYYAPSNRRVLTANGLKTVSRVGMRPTMSRSSYSLSHFRTI